MNFTQLKFVIATADLGSFSHAAQQCNVTQPTLSNGIAKLESELNQKIFERTTRTVNLTKFGEQLLPTLLSIVRLEEVAYITAKQFSNPETVIIKIGISPLLNTHIISMLTSSFEQQHQGYELVLIEDNLKVLDEKLKNKELDLILVPKVKTNANRQSLPLYKEPLFLIEKHMPNHDIVEVRKIRDKTFVMVPDSCGLAEITRNLICTSKKTIKEYQGRAMSYQVLADWASHGLGAAILPESKILPDKPKQQLMKANQPVTITFEAQWLPNQSKATELLTRYFEANSANISQGIAKA